MERVTWSEEKKIIKKRKIHANMISFISVGRAKTPRRYIYNLFSFNIKSLRVHTAATYCDFHSNFIERFSIFIVIYILLAENATALFIISI